MSEGLVDPRARRGRGLPVSMGRGSVSSPRRSRNRAAPIVECRDHTREERYAIRPPGCPDAEWKSNRRRLLAPARRQDSSESPSARGVDLVAHGAWERIVVDARYGSGVPSVSRSKSRPVARSVRSRGPSENTSSLPERTSPCQTRGVSIIDVIARTDPRSSTWWRLTTRWSRRS